MTNKELRKYFDDPMYEVKMPYIKKVLDECPDVSDPRLVRIASSFMMEADEESVKLSPRDGIKLAKAFKPTPIKDLLAKWESVGIKSLDDLKRVLESNIDEKPSVFTGGSTESAKEKAEKLEEYVEALIDNPDIILLGRPTLWPEIDSAWMKIAVLCDELTDDEQILLTAMRDVADQCSFKIKTGIPTVVFYIDNVHEK